MHKSTSATVTSVASETTSATILAANTAGSRQGALIVNTDANALYLLIGGGTASASNLSAVVAANNGQFEVPFGFQGAITGVWAGDGSGAALVTEFK